MKMSKFSNCTLLPDGLRGMKHLNRDNFLHNIKVPVLKVSSSKLSQIMHVCKTYLLKLLNFKPVQDISEHDKVINKCIHFNPEKVTSWEDLSDADRQYLSTHDITERNFDFRETQLTYENFKPEDILKAVLPEDKETVSGYSQTGHIIHLNLRSHLLEYKSLIGTVLLDKIKCCRTVINKTHIINNTYRNFNMEVIAGEEDFFVTLKESRCTFQFDFSKVYWNSRLCEEHKRIISSLKRDDILFDVFCGVGPFAVPAAKRSCHVFANDLNPEAYKWLNHNVKLNHVKMSFNSYNLDGKDFICNILKDYIKDCCTGKQKINTSSRIHITMNLPAIAVEFLKYFNGLIDEKDLYNNFNLDITVYVYCFAVGDEPIETAREMVIRNMGQNVTLNILDVFNVRNVAPKKEMMRVTFKLTKEILFGVDSDQEFKEPPLKKKCV